MSFRDVLDAVGDAISLAEDHSQVEVLDAIKAWRNKDPDMTHLAYQHPLFQALMNTIEDAAKHKPKEKDHVNKGTT